MKAVQRTFVATIVAALVLALPNPPVATARTDLAVGMSVDIGKHRCTLGFFGFNSRDDRLAVTAGHCSDQIPNQRVYAENGV